MDESQLEACSARTDFRKFFNLHQVHAAGLVGLFGRSLKRPRSTPLCSAPPCAGARSSTTRCWSTTGMVRVITQETFDQVVKENREDLGMGDEEAVKDAVQQFEAQGVDLNNIAIPKGGGDHPVLVALKSLGALLDAEDDAAIDFESAASRCAEIAAECAKGLPERVLATQNRGYETLVKCGSVGDGVVKLDAVRAMTNLLDGNPDPLDADGFKVLLSGLRTSDNALVSESLDCLLNCCVRHEHNRQNLVSNGLLNHLDDVFDTHPVRVCRVWQALVQDDDVRVPFGQAHDNARAIVEDHRALGKLSKILKSDLKEADLTLILSCLSSLTVRNEYCQAVVDEGGLTLLLGLLLMPDQKKAVTRESLRLVKTLAGNDAVKVEIAKAGGIAVIVNAMTKNMATKSISLFGCGAITAICLRNTTNAAQVVENGGAQVLTQILKEHMDAPKILIACCNAIRNVVSRSNSADSKAAFVNLEVEELLHAVRNAHPSAADAVKAALRDLDLKVELKEEWTGSGGKLG